MCNCRHPGPRRVWDGGSEPRILPPLPRLPWLPWLRWLKRALGAVLGTNCAPGGPKTAQRRLKEDPQTPQDCPKDPLWVPGALKWIRKLSPGLPRSNRITSRRLCGAFRPESWPDCTQTKVEKRGLPVAWGQDIFQKCPKLALKFQRFSQPRPPEEGSVTSS